MTSLQRAIAALSALVVVLGIASCGTSEAHGKVVRVKPQAAVALIQAGDHTVVDLRSPTAYEAGHVAGAVNIDASAPDFAERVRGLDGSMPYLVYAGGKKESAPAADTMVRAGIDRVVDAGAFGLLALAGAELD